MQIQEKKFLERRQLWSLTVTMIIFNANFSGSLMENMVCILWETAKKLLAQSRWQNCPRWKWLSSGFGHLFSKFWADWLCNRIAYANLMWPSSEMLSNCCNDPNLGSASREGGSSDGLGILSTTVSGSFRVSSSVCPTQRSLRLHRLLVISF